MSQENTAANEKTEYHTVVMVSAFLRPHRSASQLAISEPKNMPTNDRDVTYAIWLIVTPHSVTSLGTVVAKLLMSANSKK